MQQASRFENDTYYSSSSSADAAAANSVLLCNWQIMRAQLLKQWTLLNTGELNAIGPNCRRIAQLIARKYAIAPVVVENYLRNFERTIPLL